MRTVYLAGGIHGLTDTECKDWRSRARIALSSHYECLDPLRRDYRGREAGRAWDIVSGDLADIDRSDVVLVNAGRASWGTAMEVRAAHHGKKQILAFGAPDPPSPWLEYHADSLFPSLDEALTYLLEAA